MTGNVRRVGDPSYIQEAPRLVVVPDLSALIALMGNFDRALETVTSWTDLPLVRGDWHGLVIADPHTCQKDWLRDEYFIATWSDWAREHGVLLSLDFPGMPSMMTASSPGAKYMAHVQMYPKEHIEKLSSLAFDCVTAAMNFISVKSRTSARTSDASCELVVIDIVEGKLSIDGALVSAFNPMLVS